MVITNIMGYLLTNIGIHVYTVRRKLFFIDLSNVTQKKHSYMSKKHPFCCSVRVFLHCAKIMPHLALVSVTILTRKGPKTLIKELHSVQQAKWLQSFINMELILNTTRESYHFLCASILSLNVSLFGAYGHICAKIYNFLLSTFKK